MQIRLITSQTVLVVVLFAAPTIGYCSGLQLSGTNYVQNFDTIGSGLPVGWSVWTNATANALAGEGTFITTPTPWLSATAGLFYNVASTDNTNELTGNPFDWEESADAQNAATNRAPAIRLRSNTDPGAAFALLLADTRGFKDFVFKFDFLTLTPYSRTSVWTIDYGIGIAPATFTPLATVTDPTNQYGTNCFGKTTVIVPLPSAVNDQSDPVWIRIVLLSPSGPTGGRDMYGIDSVELSWSVVPPSTDPPSITAHPQSRTNYAGSTAVFTAEAVGATPMYYQWQKDGVDLEDTGNVTGSRTPTLSVASVVAADAGEYVVVVTNAYGRATSAVARLTVIDPAIVSQPAPVARTNVPGDIAQFSAQAAGTLPMTFQWLFNGAPIGYASGTMASWTPRYLTITNVQPSNQGAYCIVISNAVGVVTSAVATLQVLPTPVQRIARWTFNSVPADGDVTTGVTTPEIGSGTASCVGGTYPAGYLIGSSSDPGWFDADNSSWNIKGYPPIGTGNKQYGVEFKLSTVGYQDILVTFEQQNNSRASRYYRVQYTVNGTDYIDADAIDLGGMQNQFVFVSADLRQVTGVNNNPNFGFRIVAEFESTAIGTTNADYVATDPTQTYGSTAAAVRYDVVNVYANPLGYAAPISITGIQLLGTTVKIYFSGGASDTPAAFALQAAGAITGQFTDVQATITQVGTGTFRADCSTAGPQQFYRIRRR